MGAQPWNSMEWFPRIHESDEKQHGSNGIKFTRKFHNERGKAEIIDDGYKKQEGIPWMPRDEKKNNRLNEVICHSCRKASADSETMFEMIRILSNEVKSLKLQLAKTEEANWILQRKQGIPDHNSKNATKAERQSVKPKLAKAYFHEKNSSDFNTNSINNDSNFAKSEVNTEAKEKSHQMRKHPIKNTESIYKGKLQNCKFCNTPHVWGASRCPAFGKRCTKCNKENHLSEACRNQKTKKMVRSKSAPIIKTEEGQILTKPVQEEQNINEITVDAQEINENKQMDLEEDAESKKQNDTVSTVCKVQEIKKHFETPEDESSEEITNEEFDKYIKENIEMTNVEYEEYVEENTEKTSKE